MLNKTIQARQDEKSGTRFGELGLHDFETKQQCIHRNKALVARLKRDSGSCNEIAATILDALPFYLTNSDGDWRASRQYRRMLLPQAYDLIEASGNPTHFVTVSHPKWRLPAGHLEELRIKGAKQWLFRRLSSLNKPHVAVGGIEASIGVERNGSVNWEPHFHFVVCGATANELAAVLRVGNAHNLPPYAKPVVIGDVNNLARQLAYCTKRIGQQRIAYVGRNGRQQRRKLPLALPHQNEFDRWLLGLPLGARTVLLGCRLHGKKLRRTTKRRCPP